MGDIVTDEMVRAASQAMTTIHPGRLCTAEEARDCRDQLGCACQCAEVRAAIDAVAPMIEAQARKEAFADATEVAERVIRDNLRAELAQLRDKIEAQAKRIAELGAARPLAEALTKQLIALAMGGCTCGVKSPQAHWHEPTCTFRRAEEALENAEAIRKAIG